MGRRCSAALSAAACALAARRVAAATALTAGAGSIYMSPHPVGRSVLVDWGARDGDSLRSMLLHVREERAYHGDLMPREYERIDEQARQHQAQVLEGALAHARRVGLSSVETQGEAGTPEVDIPRVARERRADMIVMGTRGLGAVGALLLGSTAQRVVHNANVPVLLVK
jgi:nucleotide-binding universal stress UspA family protein